MMKEQKMGVLYVVATPIGNLQDMTLRAIETLKAVDLIAAEDTRHTVSLLKHFSIIKPTISLHDHNEREKISMVIDRLQSGTSIALVSDAGTPLISDPGFHLVREAKKLNITVVPIPGACALIAGLSAAGLPTDNFIFEGFLPAKEEACRARLTMLLREPRTLIFYEAPHRLLDTLQILRAVFGAERHAVVARELTKLHESVLAMPLDELVKYYEAHPGQQKGEVVILVHGSDEATRETKEVIPEDVLDVLLTELPLKQAANLASKITGIRKNVLYDLALAKKRD